ncbi:MAG: alpha-amylase family glycosyl hydrolase, partial [Acidimicrobiales bacterium]
MSHLFRVWGPRASRVDLLLHDSRIAMQPAAGEWWEVLVDEPVPAGTRYAFSLEGGPALPDPRSAHQPEGVHGPSAIVDHAAFAWADQGWRGLSLPGAVLYELHVGTFSPEGTFEGVAERLDHLVDLGIDAIEIMPVADFPGRFGWGYDGVDLFAPRQAYGGPDDLKRLVEACHRAGLGVVLDVVYNHCGPSGNYLSQFGPYLSEQHGTQWGDQVNFDGPGAKEVRRFVVDNALQWLRDYHMDGLRLDAVHAIHDWSAVNLLEQMADEVSALRAELR